MYEHYQNNWFKMTVFKIRKYYRLEVHLKHVQAGVYDAGGVSNSLMTLS